VMTQAELRQFYEALEVATATFDPATRTWSAVNTITDDNNVDSDLQLSSDSTGHLMLTWLSNPDGNLVSSKTSPSTLKFSLWNGQVWSTPAPVAAGLTEGAHTHKAALLGDRSIIVMPLTGSGSNRNLTLFSRDGTFWARSTLAADDLDNRAPSVVFEEGGEAHVVWLRGADLVHATLRAPMPEVLRASSDQLGFYDAKLIINHGGNLTLLWRDSVGDAQLHLFARIYDVTARSWSADRLLTDDTAWSDQLNGYYGQDGQLHAVYVDRAIERTAIVVPVGVGQTVISNVPRSGRADLRLLDHSLIVDLAISKMDISFSKNDPKPGEPFDVTIAIHNAGDFATGSFNVSLYGGDRSSGAPFLGTAQVSGPFEAGGVRTIRIPVTYPSTLSALQIVVDPEGSIREFTKANNVVTIDPHNSAPDVHVTADHTAGVAPLFVTFDSTGTTDLDGDAIQYQWSFADGSDGGSGPFVSHTFREPGLYPVVVTAIDARGARASAVVTISVRSSRGRAVAH